MVTKETYKKLWKKHQLSLLQSWEWAESKKNSWKINRILLNNIPCTIYERKIPILNKKFAYVPHPFNAKLLQKDILQRLYNYCKTKYTHVLIDLDVPKSIKIQKYKFKLAKTTIQPNQTSIIDLTQPITTIWKNIKPKFRQYIRKAARNKVKVYTYTKGQTALKQFYNILTQVAQNAKFSHQSFNYYQTIWNTLSRETQAKIFIVKHKDQIVGAYFVAYANSKAYELYGGVNGVGYKLKAGYLLKWHSIVAAKLAKIKIYDQWGTAPLINDIFDSKHPLYYVSLFKTNFGGKYVQYYPQLVAVFNSIGYTIYKVGILVKNIVLKIRRLLHNFL